MEAVKEVKVDAQQRDADIRKMMFDTFCNQYHSLAGFIQKLPLNPDMKAKIALFMDTSFLWTKEAFILQEAEAQRALIAEVKPETPAVADAELPEQPGPL